MGFNKLGFYEDCISEPANNYYLLTGTTELMRLPSSTQQSDSFVSGICFNSVCSAEDLQYVLTTVNGYIQLPFEIIQVDQPSKIDSNFDALTVITLVLLAAGTITVAVATIIDALGRTSLVHKNTNSVKPMSLLSAGEVVA